MKKIVRTTIIAIILGFSGVSLAQSPPHPNGGTTPTGSNTPVGGGAPIGSGLVILLSLAAGYSARKIYEVKRKELM